MRRALLVGLPRSGTTWMAEILGSHPSVTLVNEPDNVGARPMAAWAKAGLGRVPSLAVDDAASRYETLLAVAFRGRIPARGRRLRVAHRLRRPSLAGPIPGTIGPNDVVLVKSVGAYLALEWVAARFEPRTIVVWRHPLNVVASWLERGWQSLERPALVARFSGSAVWPPPSDPLLALAWEVCASTVALLESAGRVGALVLGHEASAVDPAGSGRSALVHLGLGWHDDVAASITGHSSPGTGYSTQRIATEEPARWRARLDPPTVDGIRAVVRAFEDACPVAAATWPSSPAVDR